MKRRKFSPGLKAKIVVEALKGRSLAEICAEHQISQAQFYGWKEQFMKGCSQVFEPRADKQLEHLRHENRGLKRVVGELTVELKKNEYEL